jgi:P27 family predicted phage terminase small subunit
MGLRGPTSKPPDRRQGHRDRTVVELRPAPEPAEAPEAPSRLLKVTREAWAAYWSAPVASVVDRRSDLPAIRRLFTLYDERERCYRSARTARVVAGSQGQPVLNPLYKHMTTLDAEIRQMEDRFGLTPASKGRLGITLAEAVDQWWRLLPDDTDGDDTDDPRADP